MYYPAELAHGLRESTWRKSSMMLTTPFLPAYSRLSS